MRGFWRLKGKSDTESEIPKGPKRILWKKLFNRYKGYGLTQEQAKNCDNVIPAMYAKTLDRFFEFAKKNNQIEDLIELLNFEYLKKVDIFGVFKGAQKRLREKLSEIEPGVLKVDQEEFILIQEDKILEYLLIGHLDQNGVERTLIQHINDIISNIDNIGKLKSHMDAGAPIE